MAKGSGSTRRIYDMSANRDFSTTARHNIRLREQIERFFTNSGYDIEGLHNYEAAAIGYYMNTGSWDINDSLKSGSVTKEINSIVRNIDSGLRKLSTYKGEVLSGSGMTKEQYKSIVKGGTIKFNGYISATTQENIAKNAASRNGNDISVIYRITKHKGKDVSRYSTHPEEHEVLIPRGSAFRIRNIMKRGKITYIILE